MKDGFLKDKRILIFLRSFDIGGAERQAALLANFLAKNGAIVSVWAYSERGPICDMLDSNISIKSIKFNLEHQKSENQWKRKMDLMLLALRIFFLHPHAIMPFTITPNVDCGYVWKWTGAKVCIWNQRDEWLNFLDKDIEKKAFERTPVFVANSVRGKELIEKALAERDVPAFHIPNAVILLKALASPEKLRTELNIKKDSLVAIMIANLHENKDHETLLRSWKLIVEKYAKYDPILLLAGRFDTTRERLEKLSEELGISKNVKFLGFVRDIGGLLQISNIGIFSSKTEGCPNGILECMAAGLPVVATNIAGAREALGEEYKFLVQIGDEHDFYEKISALIKNGEKRKKLGKENKKRIEEKFSTMIAFKKYTYILNRYL